MKLTGEDGPIAPRIVAEVSKSWHQGRSASADESLASMFETLIEINRKRGYDLENWRLCQHSPDRGHLTETIIAVFVKV